MSKAAYVRSQGQSRNHHCHWPGCSEQVPPALWGCRRHWYQLPRAIQSRIWAAFRPGQEVTQTPSATYVTAAREAQAWIAERLTEPCKDRGGDTQLGDCIRCGKGAGERCRWPHVGEGFA